MGTNSSKKVLEVLQDYNFLGVKQEEAYGEFQLYSNKLKRSDQMALIKLYDAQEQEKRLSLIKMRLNADSHYFTRILDYQLQTTDDLCSSISVINVGIEFFEKSLKEDIQDRRAHSNTYNEGELWYLAQGILTGLRDLQQQGIVYQDLNPINIRLTQNGELKLLDLSCISNQQSAYQKVLSEVRQVEYLSPEQLYILEKEQQNPNQEYSQEKYNVYALGMIFLVCISNSDVKEFYNNYTLNQDQINRKLQSAFEKYQYSEPFKHLIADLLQQNSNHRPTYLEILNKLSHVDSNRISPHLYAINMQDQALKSTINFKSQSNISQEQIIESHIQFSKNEQQLNDNSFNRIQTSNFQANIDDQQKLEYSNIGFEQQLSFSQNPQLTTQAGLDKLRQLKERFQIMKGEIPAQYQAVNTVPTSFTHQDEETPKLQSYVQNPYHPNFVEMDPVIQRALQRSREIMQKCNSNPQDELTPITFSSYQNLAPSQPIQQSQNNTLPIILQPQIQIGQVQTRIPYFQNNFNVTQQVPIQSSIPNVNTQLNQNNLINSQNVIPQQVQPIIQQSRISESIYPQQQQSQLFQNYTPISPIKHQDHQQTLSQPLYYNQNNIQQLLHQAELEIQKSNQISQKYFQQAQQPI